MTNKNQVTPKEELFLQQYLATGNATQSAVVAGAAKSNAGQWGSKTLKRPRVASRLAALKAELLANSETSAERVITELERVAFANITDMLQPDGTVVLAKLSPAQRAAIASYSVTASGAVKLTLVDKMQGLDRLCKNLGLFEADNAQKAEADRLAASVSDTELARRVAFALRRGVKAEPDESEPAATH